MTPKQKLMSIIINTLMVLANKPMLHCLLRLCIAQVIKMTFNTSSLDKSFLLIVILKIYYCLYTKFKVFGMVAILLYLAMT